MKRQVIQTTILLATLAIARAVRAQNCDLPWHTVEGGGEMWTTGGRIEVSATIGRPELRQYNAFERFSRMRAAAGESGTLDLSRSRALHDAITEFDPAMHGTAGRLDHREW